MLLFVFDIVFSRIGLTLTLHLQCPQYCNAIARLAQYTTPPPTPLLYAIHHTILIVATSCKDESLLLPNRRSAVRCPMIAR